MCDVWSRVAIGRKYVGGRVFFYRRTGQITIVRIWLWYMTMNIPFLSDCIQRWVVLLRTKGASIISARYRMLL